MSMVSSSKVYLETNIVGKYFQGSIEIAVVDSTTAISNV